MSMEWQPIETAPKDGMTILGWDGEDQTTIKYTARGWVLVVAADAYFDVWHPTHWMRVEPPK